LFTVAETISNENMHIPIIFFIEETDDVIPYLYICNCQTTVTLIVYLSSKIRFIQDDKRKYSDNIVCVLLGHS
jgi:hypothetical protein